MFRKKSGTVRPNARPLYKEPVAHYSRAPIAEAVIDVHAVFGTPPTLPDVQAFCLRLKSAFPHQHRINALQLALEAKGSAGGSESGDVALSSNTTTSPVGMRLSNERNDRILQVRLNGFAYSHLPPYTDWSTFRAEAMGHWEKWVEAFGPTSISRSAVRYINRIVVPENCDLDKYLNLTPRLLDGLTEEVKGYFMQLVTAQHDIDPGCDAVINTGIEGSPTEGSMNVLFDVDVFVNHSKGIPLDRAWTVLDQLRDRKNAIFEAAITEEVRRMIT